MSLPCPNLLAALLCLLTTSAFGQQCCGDLSAGKSDEVRSAKVLRITADPNNLPFSNEKLEGFENKIAALIARELGVQIQWSWRAQRRGFFRETLKNQTADLILGVPAGFHRALTSIPYYRSSYVFISRTDRALQIQSLDDPRLRDLKIGVQLVGDDGADTPPAHALAKRGLINNLVGFTLYGDYSQPNPPARIIEAIVNQEIDLAIVWGPLAGYGAKTSAVPLTVTALSPAAEPPLQFAFSIAMGVHKGDLAFKQRLDGILLAQHDEIERILDQFGVPRIELEDSSPEASITAEQEAAR